jgi:hypothetical protein
MGKILTFVLGLLVLGFAARSYLNSTTRTESGRSQPARQLDNVREKAQTIEDDARRRAAEIGDRTR